MLFYWLSPWHFLLRLILSAVFIAGCIVTAFYRLDLMDPVESIISDDSDNEMLEERNAIAQGT